VPLLFKQTKRIIYIKGNFKGVMFLNEKTNNLVFVQTLYYIKNRIDIKYFNVLGIGNPYLEVNFLYN
jgi:hypothetical protein